jgi:hypothetical protein
MPLKKKKRTQKNRYGCWKADCDLRFPSWQARDSHVRLGHPEPRKTVFEIKRFGESHSLLGGKNIKLGDRITFTRKAVVTKITTTEHSDDVQIEVAVITDVYEREQ